MASADADVVRLLQEEYGVDADSATELAKAVDTTLRATLEKASAAISLRGMDPEEAPNVLTSDHLKFALRGFADTLGPTSYAPAFIRADGDGNCLCTTLALDMEMKVSGLQSPVLCALLRLTAVRIVSLHRPQRGVALARLVLEEGREPTEEEGRPYLDGRAGETAWADGVELRRTFARFYGPDRIHRPLPASFGNVSWQTRDADNKTVQHERPMTRCDLICTEVQSTRHMDVDFSDTPEALAARVAIATYYVKDISRHGVWCSTPTIVAFSIARIEKRPVRVYFINRDSLYSFADAVPDGALPPPPPHLDEFLLDFHAASISRTKNGVPKDADDLHAMVEEVLHVAAVEDIEDKEEEEEEEEEDSVEGEDTPEFTQDITRVLFNGGHYNLALTASERMALLRVFPETRAHLVSFPEGMQAKLNNV